MDSNVGADAAQLQARSIEPCTTVSNSIWSQLPGELRDMVYKEFTGRDPAEIPMTSRSSALYEIRRLHKGNTAHISESDTDLDDQNYGHLVPFLNGLAHTCRQAYLESSHLLYQQNQLKFKVEGDLRSFIYKLPPAQKQFVRKISVKAVLSLDPPCEQGFECPSCPNTFRLLKGFTGLKHIHMEEDRIFQPRQSAGLPSRDLLHELVKFCRPLESLETIVITSREAENIMPQYAQNQIDFDTIPGWVYSFTFVIRRPHLEVELTETLQRVHRPLQPER